MTITYAIDLVGQTINPGAPVVYATLSNKRAHIRVGTAEEFRPGRIIPERIEVKVRGHDGYPGGWKWSRQLVAISMGPDPHEVS